jgi:hypothetical protein
MRCHARQRSNAHAGVRTSDPMGSAGSTTMEVACHTIWQLEHPAGRTGRQPTRWALACRTSAFLQPADSCGGHLAGEQPTWMTRSTTDTLGVGTRRAMPVSLPFNGGYTRATAWAENRVSVQNGLQPPNRVSMSGVREPTRTHRQTRQAARYRHGLTVHDTHTVQPAR